jgi:hypothetical protein
MSRTSSAASSTASVSVWASMEAMKFQSAFARSASALDPGVMAGSGVAGGSFARVLVGELECFCEDANEGPTVLAGVNL